MPSEEGRVYLVGAGPGDPGLITIKGLELIGIADTIVYDNLIPKSLLNKAGPEVELIYVGKTAGKHTMPQEEINDLLVRLGSEGKTVVRLKGGDPFVFGRGGEEALALARRKIPFEIVPGVTAGVAAPAYAGIPVSHRGLATSVHLITGHEDPTKSDSQVDFNLLSQLHGTLVFYMGVSNLPVIAAELIGHGKPSDTPAAVIHKGCTPHQRTVTGRLDEIASIALNAGITPPSVIVIGDTVSLRDETAWFEKAPLFGKSVVVTRARAQASSLCAKLSALGADVIELPAISIEPASLTMEQEKHFSGLSNFDWVFFTSQNAVEPFFRILYKHKLDARELYNTHVASIGPATSDALRARGIIPDLEPREYTSKGLLAAFGEIQYGGDAKNIVLPRADIASTELPDGLRAVGHNVIEIAMYRTVPEAPDSELIARIKTDPPDFITFASSSTAENLAGMLGQNDFAELSKRSKYISIGPVTSAKIRELGAFVSREAEKSDIQGLVNAVIYASKENEPNQ